MADRYFIMEDEEGRWLYDSHEKIKVLSCPKGGYYSPELVFAKLLNHVHQYHTHLIVRE